MRAGNVSVKRPVPVLEGHAEPGRRRRVRRGERLQRLANNVKIVKIKHCFQIGIIEIHIAAELAVPRTIVKVIGGVKQLKSHGEIKISTENLVDELGDFCSPGQLRV